VKQAAGILLVAFGSVAAVLVVTLVLVRIVHEASARRRAATQDELRDLILTALLGEPDESADAGAELRARRGRAWVAVEEQAFAMIPKIKGASHNALVELLLSRGAARRAEANTRSRSQVRRARGAYQLGTLAQPDSAPLLLPLLHDRRFLVRRSAVRALGQVQDTASVGPVVEAMVEDHTLTHDGMAAVVRLGAEAAAPLRDELGYALKDNDTRRAMLAALALGLLGDVAASALLVDALDARNPGSVRSAAAEALGRIGAPEAVEPLVAALHEQDLELQVAASEALGRLSDPTAVPGLAAALDENTHEGSRAVAAALLRLGEPGFRVLEGSGSPYAAEALAVHRVRQSA
jgi:HEAT repeat protein